MTTQLLKGARLKVARARQQLDGLEAEFKRFSDSKPYTLSLEKDVEPDKYVLIYHPGASIPDDWPIIIGEIFFNLRSALDNAVHELSVRETGAPVKNSEFPVFDNKAAFADAKKNGDPAPKSGLFKIRGLTQKTRDVIESLQPYNVAAGKLSVLQTIHEMNNRDKHRELILCGGLSGNTGLSSGKVPHGGHFTLDTHRHKLNEKTPLAWVYTPGLDSSEVKMDADISFEITFDESCCSLFNFPQPVVKLLDDFITKVGNILGHLEASVV